jgi:para-aminobenzoate synthetase component 1
MNVGGGVVYDSTAGGEYEEALWKARFVRNLG